MKRSVRFLLLLAPFTTLTTPILAASCDKKESHQEKNIKEDFKEKKEFKELIEKEEANLKVDSRISKETKEKINSLIKESKDKLERLKTPEEFKKAIEEFNKQIEELKKDKTENQPKIPKKPSNGESSGQGGGNTKPEVIPPKKPEGDQMNHENGKEPKEEKEPKNEESTPPSTPPTTPPATQPTPPYETVPSDEPNKEDEAIDEKELSELDEIAKNLKDIFKFGAPKEDFEDIKKFKKDSNKYTLWYDKNKNSILLVEGKKSPFDKDFDKDVTNFVLFTLQNTPKIKNEIQLVNDKEPIIKVKEEEHEHQKLSNQLNFTIDSNQNDDKFVIIVKYKVGKELGKESLEASKLSNESKVKIELK
ncbi:hypothetical protein [Metamycoplasma auris]|uniref:Lipoprotein n=1 Tax=Metamycoplasma auris TaxID=51363 RepID=A0A2W7FZG6_9BACT|nr:hypothetical protein [Metamycoplasma auris]PZV99819.1 hypothetical protein BCF89_1072 [Metamycoplasma auris]